MGNITIVVGAQWGDEGKGKWIDILSKGADLVARYQGGNNAGHTLYVDGKKIVLHQIPSGIFQEGITCAITAGVVVNPVEFVKELDEVGKFTPVTPERLWVSARAHVITPWNIHVDAKRETSTDKPIGTTKRGIGPTYCEKAARVGLRLGHYIDYRVRKEWITRMCSANKDFDTFYKDNLWMWEQFSEAASKLGDFVCDAETKVRKEIEKGKKLLMEGAQGALLDLDHGTYPFVTSSSTSAGGAIASLGLPPKQVDNIFGIAKAYVTRVGEGPMPTELKDEIGKQMAQKGNEFGATTGRPRRCGWLDAVALKYSVKLNGFDGIVLNKFDIMSGLKEVKLAVAYEHPKLGRVEDFPWDDRVLSACKPVWQSFEGWDAIPKHGKIDELPEAAKIYIAGVEKAIECPVTMVGTGVNRMDALYR
jgi:adenylosuccinate synthase